MRRLKSLILFLFLFCFLFYGSTFSAQPKGAKAIFDSGEGPAVVSSVTKTKMPSGSELPTKKVKYTGIAYQIMLLSPDGSFKPVTKARTFRSGERIKLLVRTNRSGYLTIVNIGPTGNTNILFNDYVEAFKFVEIPKDTNLVFTGPSGVETILIMLSESPQQIPQIAYRDMVENFENTRGAKDIVIDSMDSKFAVISPKKGYKPVSSGAKDIILESSGGTNYGVIPSSALANGGILTLEIKLKHK